MIKEIFKSRMGIVVISILALILFFYFTSSSVRRAALLGEEVNILILGTDSLNLKGRTDTIILVSFEPRTKYLRFLFIPRDTLIAVPYKTGMQLDKINHIYSRGGVKLLLSLLEALLKEDILFYIIVDYAGLRNMVDIVGGIEIYIPKPMKYTDLAGGLYINIPSGLQKLDGEKVVQYVRYRSDAGGDIGRIERQKKMIRLFIKKLTRLNTFFTSSKVLKELHRHLLTNLSLSDIINLASYARGINLQKVSMFTACGEPRLINGRSYWEVDWEETVAKWESLPKRKALRSIPDEIIRVRILNGCGKGGVARDLQDWLRRDGRIDVLETGNADRFNYGETLIIDQIGRREKACYVEKVLGFGQISEEINPEALVDVTIIIGKDFLDNAKRLKQHRSIYRRFFD